LSARFRSGRTRWRPGGSSTLPRAFDYFANAASIFCRLFDARTKEPILNGTVRLDPPGSTTAADDDGLHSYVHIRPGAYVITSSAAGFVTSSLDVTVAADQEATYAILLQPVTAPPDDNVCGLAIKRLNAKVTETVLPLSLSESGTAAVSATDALAIRLTSELPIEPSSVWATVEWADGLASGGTWRATHADDPTDGWVVFAADEALPAGVTVRMTVGAATASGETVGPVSHEFLVDAVKAAPAAPELLDDVAIEALPEIVAAAQSSVYRIVPAGVFAEPLTIQIPVSPGQDPDSLAIYYFSEAASHTGWYVGENVVGWLVPGSRQTIEADGETYIEVQVNHSGVLQLGKSAQFKLDPKYLAATADKQATAEHVPDLMTWGNDLILGVRQIDEQHKQLVTMVNDLHRAMKQRRSTTVMAGILDRLASYTGYHFGTEEELFKKHGYPETPAHVKIHGDLVAKVLDFKARVDHGDATISMDLMQFLKDWLANHIKVTDKKYVPFFHEKGVR